MEGGIQLVYFTAISDRLKDVRNHFKGLIPKKFRSAVLLDGEEDHLS